MGAEPTPVAAGPSGAEAAAAELAAAEAAAAEAAAGPPPVDQDRVESAVGAATSEPIAGATPAVADQDGTGGHGAAAVEPAAVEPAAVERVSATRVSAMPDLHLRDADPAVCPFFRSLAQDGSLAAPLGQPDVANRCAAFGEPLPQSMRQQQLVCRTDAHTGCPRYLRGSASEVESPVPERARRTMTTAILTSILLLVATMAAAISFVIARGGLELPGPSPTDAAVLPSPTITAPPTATPNPAPSPTPIPTPTATVSATPTPTPTAVPSPTSDRYALLVPCPDKPDCWIYTVRAGDNLTSIANYFGVPLAVVYELNPEMRTQSLRPGKQLILPPPTR